MDKTNHPSKEQVREWLRQRRTNPAPLPGPELIRRQLGWESADCSRALRADHAELNRL